MNYSNIIDTFTWSYSRIGAFEMCPYQFLMRYVYRTQKQPLFFSDYGSFIHKILEMYLNGQLEKNELVPFYLRHFRENVRANAPSQTIFETYFNQGLFYLENIDFPYPTPLGVEKKVDFSLVGHPFTAIIDCIANDDGIIVVDHKSRTLKPKSKRKKPTKSDEELDRYLRQLYIYSIPVKELYGEYPKALAFNCFRSGELIKEPFREEKLEEAKNWAVGQIQVIRDNEEWKPDMEYWKCRYLCDRRDECEYFQMNRG